MPPPDGERLLSQDLKTSDPVLIASIADNTMVTIGDAAIFRYYVPRVLELEMASPEGVCLLIEGYLHRMSEAGFADWSNAEKEAVIAFVDYQVDSIFNSQDEGELDTWLLGICLLGLDPSRLLQRLDQPEHETTKDELLRLYVNTRLAGHLTEEVSSLWWRLPEPVREEILSWMFSQKASWDRISYTYGLVFPDLPPASSE